MQQQPALAPQSAYRPLPPPPSARWARAASGLELVAALVAADAVLRVVGAATSTVFMAGLRSGVNTWGASLAGVFALLRLVHFALGIGRLVGLARFAGIPSRSASSAARSVFAVSVVSAVFSVATGLLHTMLFRSLGVGSLSTINSASSLVGFGLMALSTWLLFVALSTTSRALGATHPAWAPMALVATLVLRALAVFATWVSSFAFGSRIMHLGSQLVGGPIELAIAFTLWTLLRTVAATVRACTHEEGATVA